MARRNAAQAFRCLDGPHNGFCGHLGCGCPDSVHLSRLSTYRKREDEIAVPLGMNRANSARQSILRHLGYLRRLDFIERGVGHDGHQRRVGCSKTLSGAAFEHALHSSHELGGIARPAGSGKHSAGPGIHDIAKGIHDREGLHANSALQFPAPESHAALGGTVNAEELSDRRSSPCSNRPFNYLSACFPAGSKRHPPVWTGA